MSSFTDGAPRPVEADDVFSDSTPLASAGSMRQYLQSVLDTKEKQLQQAGTLGQRVLAQQMELEERVRQLQDIDSERTEEDEVSAETRLHYRDLANTLKAWDDENLTLSNTFGTSVDIQSAPVPPTADDVPHEMTSHGPSAPSASQSRRAKNAASRADDVEFAYEIGSSLLTEVRRLQSLLGERDKAIQEMKEEKDDLEKAVESLRTACRTQEQSADKFKEENWNLEVSLQELRAQLTDAQAAAQRAESESKRLTKALATSRESNDQYKNEVERLNTTAEATKAKHESDIAMHRKHAATLARDVSDLQQTVETYKVELANASRRIHRNGYPHTPDSSNNTQTPRHNDDEDDPFGPGTTGMGMSTNRRRLDTSALFPPDAFGIDSVDNSPDPSPSRPFHVPAPANELEALQQKLAHAQRQITTLKGTLNREKELRMDYRRRMLEAGLAERLDDDEVSGEDEDVESPERPKASARSTPLRGRGRGRGSLFTRSGGGRMTLAQKLGISARSPPSDQEDEGEEPFDDSSAFTSTVIQEPSSDPPVKAGEDPGVRASSPISPTDASSNRASVVSVEGMDPAFANILRRAPSLTTNGRGTSPAMRGRGIMGRRRGGTAYQEPRPSSLVSAPEALAAELGMGNTSVGMESVREDEAPEREMKEFACQTEVHDDPAPLPPVPQPEVLKVETVEMDVQTDPEVEADLPPTPVRVESSMQTDESTLASVSVSTDPPTLPILVDNSSHTEPIIAAPTSEVQVQTETEPEPQPAEEVTTPVAARVDAEIQTSPTRDSFSAYPSALSGLSERRLRYLSSASTATAVPRTALHQIVQSDDEDTHTELAYATGSEHFGATEPETETDLENYQDARSAAATPSAAESLVDNENDDDFHSMSTMTDNDFSSEEDIDDTESIKASVRNMEEPTERIAVVQSSGEHHSLSGPPNLYVSQAIGTDPPQEEPRRELAEISIQTDNAPTPPSQVVAPVPRMPALYRVGPNAQQFQFVSSSSTTPSAATTPVSPQAPVIPALQALRDSTNITAHPMRFSSPSLPVEAENDRSLDTTPGGQKELGQRQHTQSMGATMSPVVDKTRPPTMMLPPPPKMPPPPTSMPPPSFIPEKRRPPSALSFHRDAPPPRPSSPPPPELIQRATTPTFGSVLTIPGKNTLSRQSGAIAAQSPINRQSSSMQSVRSIGNNLPVSTVSSSTPFSEGRDRRVQSAASLFSDQEDAISRRSSISSEFHHRALSDDHANHPMPTTPVTPGRGNMIASTDPTIINAITQTMIGEFLYKYTRRSFAKGHGERRHKRFFWVHPYTRTLYWSSADPGSTNVSEQSAKSAYIDSVRSVLDPNPSPPGLYQYSVIVSTPQRDMKFTAPTKERHEIWLNALQYLLARPNPATAPSPSTQVNGAPVTPMRIASSHSNFVSPVSQRTGRSERSGFTNDSPWNITPRGGRRSRSRVSVGGSVGKRSGTPAAEYLRWADGPVSPSMRGFEQRRGIEPVDDELDFEIHDSAPSDQEGFEGLENVRACCDGRHTVGRGSGFHDHFVHDHTHSHHHHTHVHRPIPQFVKPPEPPAEPLHPSRPTSPAFSLRSRTSSRKSVEGGVSGLFSRFGTRRSKTVPTPSE